MYRGNNSPLGNMEPPPYSNDRHTRVTYKSKHGEPGYFQRLGMSLCGMMFGCVLVLGGFPLLFYNEGRAVRTARSLDEGLANVVRLDSADIVNSINNNKLIHVNGNLKTDLPLTDPEYGISIAAVKLKRHVEMYQWVEHEHKREYDEGDRKRVETTYSYTKEWKDHIVDSSRFDNPTGHVNAKSMLYKSYVREADPVYVGQYHLSQGLVSKINNFKSYHPQKIGKENPDVKLVDGTFYHSLDPRHPVIGDLRLQFSYAGSSSDSELGRRDRVSIISRANDKFLSPYQTKAGDQLELLYYGDVSAEDIFAAEHSSNKVITWALRFAGWFMMFIGLQMITDIIRQIVSFIPIVREIVGIGTAILSFSLATSLSLITIAIGWFAYRPLLSLAILFGAAVPIYFSRQNAKSKASADDVKGS